MGHAFAALKAREAASGSAFLLRMEDIDLTRCRLEFEDSIQEDLTWLGLTWSGTVRRQSEHFDEYRAALDSLEEQGLLYPCFCTRKDVETEIARSFNAPHGPEGPLYPGTCRTLSRQAREERITSGMPYALRLDVAKAAAETGELVFQENGTGPQGEHGQIIARPQMLGDVVLARKDCPASYHLCVVMDDAVQEVSIVTRGNDLFFACHIQRLLQALLHVPTPSYAHHALILDAAGQKFSKRNESVTLRSLRHSGVTSEEIFERLAASTSR